MGWNDKKVDVEVGKDFETYPASCLCGRPTVVAMATVTNRGSGKKQQGAASQFTGRDHSGNSDGMLQDWYTLDEYRGWCMSCWDERMTG